MNKSKVLEDACAVNERIYLLFPAGRRITVFAQQVRALTLVEALRETAWMQKASNIAVVGGGISGITAVMALHVAGLRPGLAITIFESRDQLVPLQSSCLDKNLAPHLIDWPSAKADELHADLPILDWSAGMAGEVATDLLRQFARTGISARTSTRVKKIKSDGHGVKLTIEHDGAETFEPFDAVIVAAGFGLEDQPARIKSETPSYWRVIPEKEVSLKDDTASEILISGLGDGGLIDFVLFAVPTLNHKRLCEDMTASIDVKELIERIDSIEAALWADPLTVNIDKQYAALKLDPLARQLFKPFLAKNKSFTLLTKDLGELLPTAAPLNRLAAAAMIYAIRTFTENGNSVTGAIEVQRHRRTGSPDVLATLLNASMDEGMLRLLGKRMKSFIADPDSVLPVELHPDIRAKVLTAWPAWLAAVGSKGGEERDWILALFGNLLDHRGRIGRWTRVRVGPRCLDEEIVKAVIYHLAMQTLLSDFGDAAMHDNGNVARIGGTAAAAHFCGSQFAVGDDQVARSIEMWEPRYPHIDFFPSALVLPNRNSDFLDADSSMQRLSSTRILDRAYARPPIVHASRRLRLSLEAGEAEAKAELLRMLAIEYPDV